MAERATADRVGADMQPPNYRGAIKRMRSAIPQKKTKISSLNGEISGEWDKIEGFKVNKKAGKMWLALDGLETKERHDILKSFLGLVAAAGPEWDDADLVDKAENGSADDEDEDGDETDNQPDEQPGESTNVLMGRFGRSTEEEARGMEPAPDGAGHDAFDAVETAIEAPADVANNFVKDAADTRRKALRRAGAKAQPQPEPYTGDNSDLAGD